MLVTTLSKPEVKNVYPEELYNSVRFVSPVGNVGFGRIWTPLGLFGIWLDFRPPENFGSSVGIWIHYAKLCDWDLVRLNQPLSYCYRCFPPKSVASRCLAASVLTRNTSRHLALCEKSFLNKSDIT